MIRPNALGLILLAVAGQVSAAGAYDCVVKSSRSPDKAGQLVEDSVTKLFLGKTFTVDRETGRMLGTPSNHNAYGRPQVLDPGSSEQAYKVLTIFRPNVNVDFLRVEEHAEQKRKPFLFVTGSMVMTGTCDEK